MPALSDAYGLYSNTSMFQAKAGISDPADDLTELMADAKKLTVYNSDGSDQGRRLRAAEFYELRSISTASGTAAHWFDSSGKSAFASDPKWAQLFQWQRSLSTATGTTSSRSSSAADDELGVDAAAAFMNGKIAMAYDGEWRAAFIKADKSTVLPDGPVPGADARPSDYGLGHIGGDIVAIPRGPQRGRHGC